MTRKGAWIAPEHELHDFTVLSSLFNLTEPGTYFVSAKLEDAVPDSGPEPKIWEAASNQLRFIVERSDYIR